MRRLHLLIQVRKRAVGPFAYTHDRFTKTDSGQTSGKTSGKLQEGTRVLAGRAHGCRLPGAEMKRLFLSHSF